ncbi:NAD(P)-dependent oxidoreductase [Lentilitoribacter sp. Alg239-R112]|uniref:NAD(P)-dependent oxidoreductase n=1 Tax=Lentilitoribacter sp. Alg239-R112 TaxID=2305987 RepID=UPI0013A6D1B4|nr:NAD(P)-dependent oxidoreductase [Lentilitoribacter sp. Alg239-R112]
MADQTIGFIGLGLMGAAMVDRLLSKNHKVIVLGNKSRKGIEAALAKGATEANSAKELASASDIVMLCMGTSDHVESRMLGDNGVIAGLKPNTVVVDFGTSLPSSTKMLGEKVAAVGSHYLDGPLGRTPSHAMEGKLNIMAAGDKTAYDRIEPVLNDLGENVFHLGELGTGHTIKLFNNFLAMTTASAMSEIFAMAAKSGVDPQKVYDVMSAGPLHSMMMDFIKAYAIDGNPENLAFSIKNGSKDIGYYGQMAEDLGVDSIMSKAAKNAMSAAIEDGYADNLVPEMVTFFKQKYSVTDS